MIDLIEDNIKLNQLYESYETYIKFNGWLVCSNGEIDGDFIIMMYKNNDIQNIKLVIQLYKEKVFKNDNEDFMIFWRMFENIEILKFCIELFGNELLEIKTIDKIIYGACRNIECIKLLIDTYGSKLPVNKLYNNNVEVNNLLMKHYKIKIKNCDENKKITFDKFYKGKMTIDKLIKLLELYRGSVVEDRHCMYVVFKENLVVLI